MAPEKSEKMADLAVRDTYDSWTKVSIRFGDLDPNNHVNNGAINQYFEDGRVTFRTSRMAGLPAVALAGFAVVKFSATYHAALHYPGEVEVGTVVTRMGTSSYDLGQAVFQGGKCIATAQVVTVHIDPASGKASPLPDDVRAILEGAQVGRHR